mgnify:CR=1 FL=1
MDKTILMRKTNKIFARMGFEDKVVTLEDANNNDIKITQDEVFLVGYEDEHGEECEEDGTYLLQHVDPNQIKMFKD